MTSLDPRVIRLPVTGIPGVFDVPESMDQLGTFEVFVQPKKDKAWQHEGAVHAPDIEMAFILAKETFTRRFTCVSLCVTDTINVHTSPFADGYQDLQKLLSTIVTTPGPNEYFEIYYLQKRGKQHLHAGTVSAASAVEAMQHVIRLIPNEQPVFNLWAVRTSDLLFPTAEEMDLWQTLPEKKFRDAAEYKGGDKLKNYLETHRHGG